uniref:Uncharacterized protein n=1 Tax=Leersia perrieri TaxID=77586 RepID=A0A0D9WII0_9ORYZ
MGLCFTDGPPSPSVRRRQLLSLPPPSSNDSCAAANPVTDGVRSCLRARSARRPPPTAGAAAAFLAPVAAGRAKERLEPRGGSDPDLVDDKKAVVEAACGKPDPRSATQIQFGKPTMF